MLDKSGQPEEELSERYAIAPTLASSASVETPGLAVSFSLASLVTNDFATPTLGSSYGERIPPESDKRKRNTAASARFRIKKKLKEKEMEHKILHLDELIKRFEKKVGELEMENRLLKNLIIEKGNRNSEKELLLLKQKVKLEGNK